MSTSKEEISFRKIFEQLENYFRFLLSKWIVIVIAGILGGALGLLYAYNKKPVYTAELSFVLSNTSSSEGGLLGFANQFGINLGGSSDNVFSGDNIITLMQSRRMVQQALFNGIPETNQSLINTYVKDNKLDQAWMKNARLRNAFPFPTLADKMSSIQDSLVRAIYSSIAKNMLVVYKPDKNQNFYIVTTTTQNELFSYYLTKYLVNATSAFYINTKTSSAKTNLMMLQREADSLRQVLNGAIVTAGAQTDYTFNLNPAYQVKRAGVIENQTTGTALGQAYGQVLQNLELAKITLQKETPLYQIVDEPTLPLNRLKPSKLICLIIGGFFVGALVCGFLIARKLYKDYRIKTD